MVKEIIHSENMVPINTVWAKCKELNMKAGGT
jgi:hypothetical protein